MKNPIVEKRCKVKKILIAPFTIALLAVSTVLFFVALEAMRQESNPAPPFDMTQIVDKPYEARFIKSLEKKEPLVVVITGKEIDAKDTQQIAQAVKKEKQKNTIVYTYATNAAIDSLEHHSAELKYKAKTTEKGTEITRYQFYPDVAAATEITPELDLSENKLDLVTGRLTVSISMDEKAPEESILAQAKGLAELLILYNPKAKIQQVILEVTAGSNYYHYDSKEAQLLANVSYQA
ncbi:hypothetical protein [Carnobacterium mobile]|uniref:hypothetical protein n=1 Tax=Carnobacterium mobile TaxID=2750 RepID=UPI001868AFF7|nr:hypothetical protein [Carnobacterium mobile]